MRREGLEREGRGGEGDVWEGGNKRREGGRQRDKDGEGGLWQYTIKDGSVH